MTDPKEVGFTEPLDTSPIELEEWGDGGVEDTANGAYHRVWRRDVGDARYIVHYYQGFDRILFEKWLDGNLVSVPAEANFDGYQAETEDFLQAVDAFFKLVSPQI